MDYEVEEKGSVQATANLVKALHKPEVIFAEHPTDGTKAPVILAPKAGGGFELLPVKSHIDQYRANPEYRDGKAVMKDLGSFIAHVNRFKTTESVIFADDTRDRPGLLAVLDYHDRVNNPGIDASENTGGYPATSNPFAPAQFLRHRTEYRFPLSDEWNAWGKGDGSPMSQGDFAAFVEERALDLLPAPTFQGELSEADLELKKLSDLIRGKWASPERMMELSRGLAIFESSKCINATNINSGEGIITFEEEHHDAEGKKLEVPSLFLIGVPVFKNGPAYRVVVRLRYRKQGSQIIWFYDLYRHDKVFDHAFTEACTKAKEETELPLLVGFPEAKGQ